MSGEQSPVGNAILAYQDLLMAANIELDTLRTRVAELEAALEPLREALADYGVREADFEDDYLIYPLGMITFGECRRAKSLLSSRPSRPAGEANGR